MNRRRLLITIASLFTLCAGLFAKGDTYIYDYWGQFEKSPDVYRVSKVICADDLKLDRPLINPNSIHAFGNTVYIVDTDNSRILELEYTENKDLKLVEVHKGFNGNGQVVDTFNKPMDIYVNGEDGTIFIADTENSRTVKLDKDWNYILSFLEPHDPTYDNSKPFYPQKVVADSKGRAYVLAKNVNKGFLKYEFDGTFTMFYGANKAKFDWTDYLWKKFATRAQREQMVSFVPTEYSNVYMDHEGFLYAVTKSFDEWDIRSDKSKPIRRLNALGEDILVKNGEEPPIGDLQWSSAGGISGPAHFNDITVLENDVYIAVDETRGRLFGYNNQGLLLFVFGNRGNIDGNFRTPIALDHIGKDLLVLDQQNASVTIFTPTDYGNLIYEATELFAVGDYDGSADKWAEVLSQNGNYDLAYIGLGKSCFRQEKYSEAMEYFKLKKSRRNYSKAFRYYRKEWFEANITWIIVLVVVLIVVPLIVKGIKSLRKELKSL